MCSPCNDGILYTDNQVKDLIQEVMVLSAQYSARTKVSTFNVVIKWSGHTTYINIPQDFETLFKSNQATVEQLFKCRDALRRRLI